MMGRRVAPPSGPTVYPYTVATTLNSASAELVTLAPGLRPERRFAPLARGQSII